MFYPYFIECPIECLFYRRCQPHFWPHALFFSKTQQSLACASDKTIKTLISNIYCYKTALKSLFWVPICVPVYHCWFANQAEGKFKIHLSPCGSQNKDLGAASLMLLIGVRFCLRYRISKTQRKLSFRISIFPLKNFIFGLFFQKLCESLFNQ